MATTTRRAKQIAGISRAAAFIVLAFTASHSLGENAYMPAYFGMQPQLVQGIQEGLVTDKPKVRHVYLAAPDTLAIVVDAQAIHSPPLVKYEKRPGDEIRRSRPQNYGTQGKAFHWGRTLIRDGVALGDVVGPNEDHYSPPHRLMGEKLDTKWSDKPASFAITSKDDATFAQAVTPLGVYRKSKPEAFEWVANGGQDGSARHEFYLKLPKPLTPGKQYRIEFPNNPQLEQGITFTFDDTRLRTEAVQVNQVGYHPRQAAKSARLSMWLGTGGGVDFSAFKDFQLVDDRTGQTVFTGRIVLVKPAVPDKEMALERTDDPGDDLPTNVYQLDFSSFAAPGVYRIVIPRLGTSFPFRIDENVWLDAAKVSAHGYLNQRSGIALGPPYTKYVRPRNFHPADGFPVRRTDPAKFYDPERFPTNSGNPFPRIQAAILEDTTVPEAWGGWHDAADYDRSILPQQHTRAVHAMLDLVQSNAAYFEKLNLNIPESGNNIPDLVDEALWCMDLFLRIQQPDGGVPSAIESIEHPSEPSFLLAQPTAITPPTPQTCHLYAAASAQMSIVLQKYDVERAATYRDSALRAMEWAQKNPQVPNIYARDIIPLDQHANLAAAWMFALTGDAKWHDEFKRTLKVVYPDGKIRLDTSKYGGPFGLAAYAFLPAEQVDVELQKQCREAIIRSADAKVERTAKWTWHLGPQRYSWEERLGQPWELMLAHRLTGEAKYIAAIEQQAQFALGMNPTNASYTTGLGSRQVTPFNLDSRYLGVPYPEGITPYGPAPRNIWGGSKMEPNLEKGGLYPAWAKWPWAESFFNVRFANITEYTVTSMANPLMARAYLAQHLAKK